MNFEFNLSAIFEELEQNITEITTPKQTELSEILTDNFIKSKTKLNTLNELLELMNITSQKDLDNINISKADEIIKNISDYSSWEEFLNSAGIEHLQDKLNL